MPTTEESERIVHDYAGLVYRYAYLYLKNRHDAEDAAQEVFIKYFGSGGDFTDEDHRKAWLIRVTVNHCKDVLKSGWRRKILLVEQELPAIDNEDKKEVVIEVLKLPLKYRNVIYMHYYEDYSVTEISKLLRIKETTIKSHLKRGRELLKARLTGGWNDEER